MSIIDYYNQLAKTYDSNRFGNSYGIYIDTMERAILTEWLQGIDKSCIVDFGCGTGRFLDFSMTGVDGSAEMLQVAAAKFPDRRLIQANLTEIPLPDNSAQAGLCFHVLMHFDFTSINSFLKNASRIISPGGKLILDIPSAPRRSLFKRVPADWHGNTASTIKKIQQWDEKHWKIRRWRGIVFFPIHRFPPVVRPFFMKIDAWLGRTFLARYSSYYVIELERLK